MNMSFRDKELALKASEKIKELAGEKKFKFMHKMSILYRKWPVWAPDNLAISL